MPYTNVPKDKWPKMDRCVADVQRRSGLPKGRAIAVCHASIVGGKALDEQITKELEAEKESPSTEVDEKMTEIGGVYLSYGGATSFEEVDKYLEAQEMAWEAERLTSRFRSLMDNILAHPEMDADEKTSAMQKLVAGFKKRVAAYKETGEICDCGCFEEEYEVDDDEKAVGWFEGLKRKISGASRNDMPDSAFAYIEPGGEKDEGGRTKPRSLRHYPIHDKPHVRNALARASQAMNRGGKSAEIAKKAMAKIRAAAKKMGVAAGDGDDKALSGIEIYKDSAGAYRWFGWVTNKWRDRDASAAPRFGGEIIPEAAHKDFIAHLDKHPDQAPQFWAWHTPGTARKSAVDWWDYADGFLVVSGPLTADEAKALERAYATKSPGMSHGFFGQRDSTNGLIPVYRSFEVSDLPRDAAANLWTDLAAMKEEAKAMGFSPDKRSHLVSLLGEQKVAELEADTTGRAKALEALGVEFKETPKGDPPPDPKPGTEAPVPAAKQEPAAPVTKIANTSITPESAKALSAYLESLAKSIADLQEAVKGLKKTDDEKVAEIISPRAKDFVPVWEKAASQSLTTVIEKDDPLAAVRPGMPKDDGSAPDATVTWVSEAMNVGKPGA